MNPAIATVVAAVTGGVVALIVAVIQSAVGRDGRRADIADKVSHAWDAVSDDMREQISGLKTECTDCKSELAQMKRALRAILRAFDTQDLTATDVAIATARDLLE